MTDQPSAPARAPIDLHLHTYYSDGRFAPHELVEAAARAGMRAIAITDHDNLRGSREAAPLALAAGIELVPAIEITTSWPGASLPPEDASVDLLGYFVDRDDPVFDAYTTALLNDLHDRIAWSCARMTENGYPLAMENVFAQNPRYGGTMQMVQAIQRKGYALRWADALRLMDTVWLKARETPFTITAAIEQVHLAGGVAVLAHPSIVRPRRERLTAEGLRPLVEAGLDGIEIYHRRLDEDARRHFLGLAEQFGLLVTGGSDLHGWVNGLDELGAQPVTPAMLEDLRRKSRAGSAAA